MKLSIDSERCVGCQHCMFACARNQGKVGLSEARLGVRSIGGMERGFTIIVCRACNDPPCARVCPTKALRPRKGGGVNFIGTACVGCGNCRDACLIGAVFWDEESSKPMICIQCGYCSKFCPHGVIKAEKGGVDGNA